MSVLCVSYILHKKGDDNWNIEHIKHILKPTEDSLKGVEELSRYYNKSLDILKEDDEEEAQMLKKEASKK